MGQTPDDVSALRALLSDIDGAGYGAYKRLRDTVWRAGEVTLRVERVQSDPYAPPSRWSVHLPADAAGLPAALWAGEPRRRALADHLARLMAAALDGGSDKSGFRVDAGGQEVLERSVCAVDAGGVTVRLGVDLPASGRRIRGRQAAALVCDQLPAAAQACLRWAAIDQEQARTFVETVEDACALRAQLPECGLVAFVADGAVLPRRSGVDQRPLAGDDVVAFAAPPTLRTALDTPNSGTVPGMGVPEGVTVVVGGGFHGKSTLLRALERGVYDHVPGDGREHVVSRADAVKIRAEDGRRVCRVDISAFVGELPGAGADTTDFSSDNASGSTSQAANIVEALEAGAATLLIDEDTSATNLMIRDLRMQQLVAADREPLTPFCDLARPLHRDHGVSCVVVIGGSGDYLDVADQVIWMDAFVPHEVTERARAVAAAHPGRRAEAAAFAPVRQRIPDPNAIDPRRGGKVKTKPRGTAALGFGDDTVDLAGVEQLVCASQTAGIAQALVRLVDDGLVDGRASLAEVLDRLDAVVAGGGAEAVRAGWPGDLALPRRLEVAAALNRLRSLRVVGFADG